jgi:glucokinase
MKVLAGDVGGTKTWLALTEFADDRPRLLAEQRYDSRAFDEFSDLLEAFLREHGAGSRLAGACIAVAGPVRGDEVRVTNLPWRLSTHALRVALQTEKVRLINDFQATGYGIAGLSDQDLVVLQHRTGEPGAPRAVIGAGTGLGQGILVWQGDHYEPLPTEGGHADFGPSDAVQVDLLRYLKRRYGHVSYERVLSGPGLTNIYRFLHEQEPDRGSAQIVEASETGDAGAAIAEAAMDQSDALAERALDMFVAIYGAQAGNLALACLASGGVYVAGGIAPKILRKLQAGSFMQHFLAKGRMSEVLTNIPVQIVVNAKVGLLGAALAASRL